MRNCEFARDSHAALGIDTDNPIRQALRIPISMHCWPADDLGGFEVKEEDFAGGSLMANGNCPGRARTPDEARADYEQVLKPVPGTLRLSIHAFDAESGGKVVAIQMTVTHGRVTLLSVVQRGAGKLLLLVAEGESVPGPVLQIGNTSRRYKFSLDVKQFMNEWCKAGPAHHCAIGFEHVAGQIERLAAIFGLESLCVC